MEGTKADVLRTPEGRRAPSNQHSILGRKEKCPTHLSGKRNAKTQASVPKKRMTGRKGYRPRKVMSPKGRIRVSGIDPVANRTENEEKKKRKVTRPPVKASAPQHCAWKTERSA